LGIFSRIRFKNLRLKQIMVNFYNNKSFWNKNTEISC